MGELYLRRGAADKRVTRRCDETVVCVAHRPDDVPRGFDRLLRLGA
jgi:ABC-type molybdenum transport system ATPase subunit/photorepair protein PhrA